MPHLIPPPACGSAVHRAWPGDTIPDSGAAWGIKAASAGWRVGCCTYRRVFPALSSVSVQRCEAEKRECVTKEGSLMDLSGCGVTGMPNGSVFLPAVG